jgi:pimeloyl-ACP methyl ester carboxylesterase
MRRFMMISLALLVLGLVAALLLMTQRISAEVEQRHPPKGEFVVLKGSGDAGGRLHLVDHRPANAPLATLLLLHGASSTHADLLAVLEPSLREHYRIIAPDRPGHGWSERIGRDPQSPVTQAQIMAQLLETKATGPVILVAHSLAGVMAMNLALERPDLVRGVVLLAAVTHSWDGSISWYYHPASWPVIGPIFNRLIAIPAGNSALASGAQSVFTPRPMTAGYIETAQIRLLLRPAVFRANAEDVSALHDQVLAQQGRYGQIKVPLVAFHGLTDTITSAILHSQPLPGEIKGARYIPLPETGHMPHHAATAQVVAEIEKMAQETAR